MNNDKDYDIYLDDGYISNELYEDLVEKKTVREKNYERIASNEKDELEDIIKDLNKEHEQLESIENVKESSTEKIKKKIKTEKDAKNFLTQCKDYLSSKEFTNKCMRMSRLHNVSEKKIAETFAQKVLGVIGDTLGIVIKVTYNACNFLIKLLTKILYVAVGTILSIASKLVSFFTFGYTCIA